MLKGRIWACSTKYVETTTQFEKLDDGVVDFGASANIYD